MDKALRRSLQVKLNVVVIGVTVVALGIFGAVMLRHVQKTEYVTASEDLRAQTRIVKGMLTLNHELAMVAADQLFGVFEAMVVAPFELDERQRVRVGGHDLPTLRLGGRPAVEQLPLVDEFSRNTGGHVATIFVRQGDAFVRVATSLRDERGRRAVGTALGLDHPAHGHLLDGASYVGPARLFGRTYMTKYRPLRDAGGRVIGALFVGLDLSPTIARIKEQLKTVRVGKTGYVYLLDAQPGDSYGTLLEHPTGAGRNVFDVLEPSAQALFHQALADGDGLVGRYEFRDADDRRREKIAAFASFPEWQWVIGAGAYYEELTTQELRLEQSIGGAMLVAALAIILALQAAIRRLVLAPLLALHETLHASEERFRSLVTSSDDLIYTTDAFGRLSSLYGQSAAAPATAGESLLGRRVAAVLGADDPQQHEAAHARSLAGEHVVYEWSIERPEGRIDFQSSLAPMRDAHGRVCGLVGIGRDVTEHRRAQARVQHLAEHDALTGLPNRALMHDRLQQALRQAERDGSQVGVLFIDLDHFKAINDQYGHEAGDQLLQAVARRLLACVRQADTVARIGGDEFVVVIGQVAGHEALAHVADKVLSAFSEPFDLTAAKLEMSPSIGISRYPADGSDAATLLKLADAAMYKAKAAGRGSYRCAGTPA